jgi:hypothetical protein
MKVDLLKDIPSENSAQMKEKKPHQRELAVAICRNVCSSEIVKFCFTKIRSITDYLSRYFMNVYVIGGLEDCKLQIDRLQIG